MSTPPLQPLTYSFVISETQRIVASNFRLFNSLSLLFILPVSISITLFPAVHNLLRPRDSSSDHPQFPLLTVGLLFALFSYVSAILAVGSVTHSVIQIIHNRPASLRSAVKSGFTSFFPLAITCLIAHLIIFSIPSLFLYSFHSVINSFKIDPDSSRFLTVALIYAAVFLSILIYQQVNWSLASVIVVAESELGFPFPPLKRSGYLVEGERLAILCIFLPYALAVVFIASTSGTMVTAAFDGVFAVGKSCFLLAATILFIWFILTRMLLSLFIAKTIVYLYCKAARGEVFSGEHAPFVDGEKVPLLVSVVV
ncbi:hypothetical protein LINPERPRIM_LOCUS32034 [Linum perenne]